MRPERVALFCRGTELTYRALDQRANQFANHVRNSGAAPEALVAVVLPQGLDQIAAIIGVLKAGAAYVPIDPSYPASRIRHILDDARPHVIIDDEVVAVVDRWCAERADGVAGLAELDAGNAAYVIYTSGSTGAPKGVVIEHGSLARYWPGRPSRIAGRAGCRWSRPRSPSMPSLASSLTSSRLRPSCCWEVKRSSGRCWLGGEPLIRLSRY